MTCDSSFEMKTPFENGFGMKYHSPTELSAQRVCISELLLLLFNRQRFVLNQTQRNRRSKRTTRRPSIEQSWKRMQKRMDPNSHAWDSKTRDRATATERTSARRCLPQSRSSNLSLHRLLPHPRQAGGLDARSPERIYVISLAAAPLGQV